jgi:hypothetical protein
MKIVLIFSLCVAFSTAECQDYQVISKKEFAEVINTEVGYKFDAPLRWHISVVSPNPIAISYPPSLLRYAQVAPPKGGAEIDVSSDMALDSAKSIESWIQKDTSRYGFAERKELSKSMNPNFARAVQVTRYEDVGDDYNEEVIRWITTYVEFRGHILAIQLKYRANDPKARSFEKVFDETLRSFTVAL